MTGAHILVDVGLIFIPQDCDGIWKVQEHGVRSEGFSITGYVCSWSPSDIDPQPRELGRTAHDQATPLAPFFTCAISQA
jgi:hypothetical protein